jgi:putative oxidoreductase
MTNTELAPDTAPARSGIAPGASAIERIHGLMARIPDDAIALVARLSIAGVFLASGRTKMEGFAVSENAIALFQDEYRLPLISPWLGAHLAAFAEHLFPVLLVLGLATRLSALALLGMTLVIQVFVYPDAWPTHGVWAACLLFLMARGPGAVSLDAPIARRLRSQP